MPNFGHYKIIDVSAEFVLAMCIEEWRGDGLTCIDGLPAGTTLREVSCSFVPALDPIKISLVVEHPSFPLVARDHAPRQRIVFTRDEEVIDGNV